METHFISWSYKNGLWTAGKDPTNRRLYLNRNSDFFFFISCHCIFTQIKRKKKKQKVIKFVIQFFSSLLLDSTREEEKKRKEFCNNVVVMLSKPTSSCYKFAKREATLEISLNFFTLFFKSKTNLRFFFVIIIFIRWK